MARARAVEADAEQAPAMCACCKCAVGSSYIVAETVEVRAASTHRVACELPEPLYLCEICRWHLKNPAHKSPEIEEAATDVGRDRATAVQPVPCVAADTDDAGEGPV